MNTNIDAIKGLEYIVLPDKSIAHQDLLYKLIIIGDTGNINIFKLSHIFRCGKILPFSQNYG